MVGFDIFRSSFICCLPRPLNMKTSGLAHFSGARNGARKSATAAIAAPVRSPLSKFLKFGQGYWLGLILAGLGLGLAAERTQAQIVYYERPVSTTVDGDGYVATASGIGLNIRSGPGLEYPVIGGIYDGTAVKLEGAVTRADGYTWQQVSDGGYVATEYVTGSTVNVSYDPCGRPTSACGGPAEVVQISYRPVSTRSGPYTVAVPGNDAATLRRVRSAGFQDAYPDRAREGGFVNAGSFASYEAANASSAYLRTQGLDARVIYK